MKVIKRNGRKEDVDFNKILNRIKNLCENESLPKIKVDHVEVSKKVIDGLYDGVTSSELDELAAETSAMMSTKDPDYEVLASRIEISSLHKETGDVFSKKIKELEGYGFIDSEYSRYVESNAKWLDKICNYSLDFNLSYFGIKTLKRAYLMRSKDKKIIERPQDMWLRVASFIHREDKDRVVETYRLMSNKYFTHATPTLFNSGMPKAQLSSCFLLDINEDSIEGIYKTLSDCAKISQLAGGIGLSIHKIRGKGSHIKGTNGVSNGIVPMLRNFDMTARYVDQGGGKRKGSFAIYLEPWHLDIYEFLDLKKNHGKEEMRARDLFYALWIPDLFMQRVRDDEEWTLVDPSESRGILEREGVSSRDDKGEDKYQLSSFTGKEFERAYKLIEAQGENNKKVKARDLWNKILESQIETGTPYMLYKDSANRKSNQQNLGAIKSSNLCTEIIQYTDKDETAVCNLASIGLPSFVRDSSFDFDMLYAVSRVVTRNLDIVIDVNFYPTREARESNVKHRPIGIGVQGLADVFALLKMPFESDEAKELNRKISETIYKGSIDESIQLAKEKGAYKTFNGSPASKGKLQFDLWDNMENPLFYDWSKTKALLKENGLRNSLLIAPMPTASTSQILGNNEAFEPFSSNMYVRRTLSGEFIVVNKHLIRDLKEVGLWSESLRVKLINNNGSVQDIQEIPLEIRDRYKTAYEMSMKNIIDMSADRGLFTCQSQSLNIFMLNPTISKLNSMHFYGWGKGLKTGMYYLRTKSAVDAIKFTIVKDEVKNKNTVESCSLDGDDCLSCGS